MLTASFSLAISGYNTIRTTHHYIFMNFTQLLERASLFNLIKLTPSDVPRFEDHPERSYISQVVEASRFSHMDYCYPTLARYLWSNASLSHSMSHIQIKKGILKHASNKDPIIALEISDSLDINEMPFESYRACLRPFYGSEIQTVYTIGKTPLTITLFRGQHNWDLLFGQQTEESKTLVQGIKDYNWSVIRDMWVKLVSNMTETMTRSAWIELQLKKLKSS